MNKITFRVEKIEEQPVNKNGTTPLKIYLRSGGKLYIKAVKKKDYLDTFTRKGIHQLWIKSIREAQEEEKPDLKKAKKDKKVLADILGKEFEDEEV